MLDLRGLGFSGILKDKQRDAVRQLLEGGNALAVLPTGFGKNFISAFLKLSSTFKNVKEKITGEVCSFTDSIVDDQILEAEALGLTATSLEKSQLQDISNGNFQLIFASAEQVLDKEFLKTINC